MKYYSTAAIVILAYFASDVGSQDYTVSQKCLGCICEGLGGCNPTNICFGDVCGPFKLTQPFWIDGGKPTVNGESSDNTNAYTNCAGDLYCSALAVQGYMGRYRRDCNGDGRMDCDDFAAIHQIGPFGCQGVALPEPFGERYRRCKQITNLR